MPDNILDEVRVPALLRVVLRLSCVLGAAPVRLRRVRSRWLLATSPRWAHIQRLVAYAICAVTLSAAVFAAVKGKIDTDILYGSFTLIGYIRYIERCLRILACMIGLPSAPERVKRIVSQLQQLQQVTYYIDDCGISSTIKTQGVNNTFLKVYLLWQIFDQTQSLIVLLLGTFSDKFPGGVLYIPLFYQKLIVVLLELQWILTVVEISRAIVKLNDKIEQQLKNVALIHSMNSNFTLPREFPRCFEVICDLVRQMDTEDGLLVLLSLTISFLRMLITVMNLISTIMTLTSDITTKCVLVVRMLTLCVTIFINLLIFIEPCHRTQYELERTFILLSKISSEVKRISGQSSTEVDQFLLIAQMRDAKFSPMGVFRITRSLITSIIGGLVTYLIIILQMKNFN